VDSLPRNVGKKIGSKEHVSAPWPHHLQTELGVLGNKSGLGDMHTNKRENKGHEILCGLAKAYIHGAHPHSTHIMTSIITIMKNYLSQLSQFSHFSTWHSTPLVDVLQ